MQKIYHFPLYILIIGINLFACGESSDLENAHAQRFSPQSQAVSLLGDTLYSPIRSKEAQEKLEKNLEKARKQYQSDPNQEMNIIWYGRRVAYLSRYEEAIDIYTQGLKKFPNSYKLLRHRGHRYISVRKFDKAIEDLSKAASLAPESPLETEPDGIPNKMNQPLSSTQFNIWYHLGLAYYLKHDFEKAAEAYQTCMDYSINDDLLCATVDWYYMTLRRAGKHDDASVLLALIHQDMEIIENDSYFKRLQMYQGHLDADEVLETGEKKKDKDLAMATQGYGVGNWFLANGDTTQAKSIFQTVVDGIEWAAFGYIAAESDLVYLKDQ